MMLPSIIQYPSSDMGFKVFIQGNSWTDTFADGYSMGTTYWGGNSANNFMAQAGVDGISLKIRWSAIEATEGVYDFTGVDKYIAQVAARALGKPIAFHVVTSASDASAPHLPAYILADEVAYGGYPDGHGGSVQSRARVEYSGVRWHNANLMAKWQLFINALASRYKTTIAYVFLDEFWSDVSYETTGGKTDEVAAAGAGNRNSGKALLETLQTIWVTYAQRAFGATPVFCKYNYIGGCNEKAPIHAAKANGLNFAAELALPAPYDYRYPKPKKASITFQTITENIEIGRSFAPDKDRLVMSEYKTSSTYGDYTPEDMAAALRYAAYALEGAKNGGFYQVVCPDGIGSPNGTGTGLWCSAIGEMLNSRAYRS